LQQAIDLYNEQRALWRALRQRWIDGDLSIGDWYDLRWVALTADPDSANVELAACLNSSSVPDSSVKANRHGPRLLILGGMEVHRRFLTFLETCGARVVAEDSEADERILTEPVSLETEHLSSMEALAAAYLNKPPGPRPNALSRRLTNVTRFLDERGVQGIIGVYPKFADAYLAEYIELADLFRERGLPTLLLEDDGESGFSGQQRTRVEAFLEMLT
jgi:benzoyl-CoA reductase/2-hydroxyglutaryl-CoA dehydratase subunit BcrC/BadD/HgdB